MRSMGIDAAGTGYSGAALAIDDEPIKASCWKPPDARESDATKIVEFGTWIKFKIGLYKPDIITVEELAVFLNKNSIRSLAKREGVALYIAKRSCPIVVNPGVTKSRGIVFGNGKLSKDEAWVEIRKKFPNFDFGRKTSGGTDKADAMTHALAGPTVAERR